MSRPQFAPVTGAATASLLLLFGLLSPSLAMAQRADANATTMADDAFGFVSGGEAIGLYGPGNVRGFSPGVAGNDRIEGLFFDRQGIFTDELLSATSIRVGFTALDYLFPAPSGIVDHHLRTFAGTPKVALTAGIRKFGSPFASLHWAHGSPEERWDFVGGIGLFPDYNHATGGDTQYWPIAAAVTLHRAQNTNITLFTNIEWYDSNDADPVIYVGGDWLPPEMERGRRLGQPWAQGAGVYGNAGILMNWKSSGGWHVEAGAFHSFYKWSKDFSLLFESTQTTGKTIRTLIASPPHRAASISGEARLSRRWQAGDTDNKTIASIRGRVVNRSFGGEDIIDLGTASVHKAMDVAEPVLHFGNLDGDRIEQYAVGLQHQMELWERLQLVAGVQNVSYFKRFEPFADAAVQSDDRRWLYNGSAAFRLSDTTIIYGAYTRGLEESGVAPANAVNRNEGLPAIVSEQKEIGIRWQPNADWSLNAGIFELTKPFAALRADGVFDFVGEIRNRGVEFSLRAHPVSGLTAVAGLLFIDPRLVSDTAVDGLRPVGTAEFEALAHVDYALPWLDGVSVDIGASYRSRVTANQANSLHAPEDLVVDLGARWRIELPAYAATLRFLVSNVFDHYAWYVDGSEGFQYTAPRTWSLYVTAQL